jgi:hypothetical protein
MAHDVFISHSSKDKPTADAVCAVLESKSIRCWVAPRDIQPGADWGESIIEAIKGSRVMVLVFSKNANESVQIKREVERAVHHGVAIIPLRIEDILPTGALEYSISSAHWLDAFTPPMERHLTYLANTVQAILEGKPPPKALPPLPPARPSWLNAAIGGGIVAGALLIYILLHVLFPPSIKGNWNLTQATIADPQASAISDLINPALTGSNIKGQLQVKSLNEYSATITATDSGTVKSTGNVLAPGGINSAALTFTPNSTHKDVVVTYQSFQNDNGAYAAYGAAPGDKVILFGVNAGGGEVLVHGTQGADGGSGPVNAAVVGTWSSNPFDLNPPNNRWGGTLEIHADGTYVLTATHTESGILTATGGNWTAQPSNSLTPAGMPTFGFGSSLLSSGHYSFSGSNTLNVGTGNGTFTFTRGW